jgi:hypothetical protein
MDEVITCICGNQSWVIGFTGTRCDKCGEKLGAGEVVVNITQVNERLRKV